VPRPRLHLIRLHGVLAPNAKLRSQVVPKVEPAPAHTCEHAQAHSAQVRMSWARLLKRVLWDTVAAGEKWCLKRLSITPDELEAFNKTEIQKWIKLVKAVGIQPE